MESVGHMIRKARKEKGRSIEAISAETKIPAASLRLLEADKFDSLPGDIFVRGFLKSCCQALALQENDVIDKYLTQTGCPADVRSTSISGIGGRRNLVPRRMRGLSWVVALIIFLLLGAALLFIIFRPPLGIGGEHDRTVRSRDADGTIESTL